MRRFMLLMPLVATALLSACGEQKAQGNVTTVKSSETVNGEVTKASSLKLTGAYVRPVMGTGTTTAAYVSVENRGPEADRLLSVSCDCADMSQLHSMSVDNGMMKMAEVTDGFEIAPGSSLALAPGGNHIMLMGLKAKPEAGQEITLTLHFAKAGNVVVTAPVKTAP